MLLLGLYSVPTNQVIAFSFILFIQTFTTWIKVLQFVRVLLVLLIFMRQMVKLIAKNNLFWKNTMHFSNYIHLNGYSGSSKVMKKSILYVYKFIEYFLLSYLVVICVYCILKQASSLHAI